MYRLHRIRKKFADAGAIIFYIGLIFVGLISFCPIWFVCKISNKLDERRFKKDFAKVLDGLKEDLKEKERRKWFT